MSSQACPQRGLNRYVLLGAGGHALVVEGLSVELGHEIVGVCDPELYSQGRQSWNGISVLGDDSYLQSLSPAEFLLLNGIGMMPGGTVREKIFQRMVALGFYFPSLVHPAAWVSRKATLEGGVQVMPGCVVQPGTSVGENSILNTGATVDHDCAIGKSCHIAPGATLCGNVSLGDGVFIGAGATVIQGVTIGSRATICAGALVSADVGPGARVR